MITRGQRLATRALALSLVSGVIVGVTGAAGENTTAPAHRVSIESSAFVRPATTVAVSATTSVPRTRWHGDGISHPVVVPSVPVASVPPVPVPVPVAGDGNGNGNGNGQGHDHGNGNGNGNGNGDGNGQGQGQGQGDGGTVPTGPGDQGGNPGSPQIVPPTDPGPVVPTGDGGDEHHDHGHHRGDGQGAGNSGQTNVPLPVPTPNPVIVPTPTPTPSSGPTVAHTPVTAPPTPVTTPATGVTSPPTTKPTTPARGNGFRVSGLVPVTQKKNHKSSHGSSPLLSAANAGISVPLSRAAANLAHMAGSTGLGGGSASAGADAVRLSASQTAAAAARAKAAQQELARKKASAASKSSSLPQVFSKTVTQIVRFIPSSIWIALAASLGLALMGLTAAVVAGRRARRQARRVAEVSAVALTDPLTSVLNRRGFIEAAERELDRAVRHGRPFALSYVDVRGLKRVNDGEGHLAGDQLLKAASAVLTESVRAHDVVGRLGGDEFGILLAEQTTEEAAQVTERISDQVTATRAELGFAARWDLTVGTAAFPEDGTTIDQLLAAADRRLYEKRGIELAAAR